MNTEQLDAIIKALEELKNHVSKIIKLANIGKGNICYIIHFLYEIERKRHIKELIEKLEKSGYVNTGASIAFFEEDSRYSYVHCNNNKFFIHTEMDLIETPNSQIIHWCGAKPERYSPQVSIGDIVVTTTKIYHEETNYSRDIGFKWEVTKLDKLGLPCLPNGDSLLLNEGYRLALPFEICPKR